MFKKIIIALFLITVSSVSCSIVEAKEEQDYEYAEYVWDSLQEAGYNDYVSAGVLGNIMVECGGLTLDLQPLIDGGGYYGICQWSNEYYPELKYTTLEEQCEHLINSMEQIINLFGEEEEYSKFIELKDEKEAALIFAKYYEVCGSSSYEIRQECATTAYEYFLDRKESEVQTEPHLAEIQNKNEINYFLTANISPI